MKLTKSSVSGRSLVVSSVAILGLISCKSRIQSDAKLPRREVGTNQKKPEKIENSALPESTNETTGAVTSQPKESQTSPQNNSNKEENEPVGNTLTIVPTIKYSRSSTNSKLSGERLLGVHCQNCHNENAGNNSALGMVSLIVKTTTSPKTTNHVETLKLAQLHAAASVKVLKQENSTSSKNTHKFTLANLRIENEFEVFLKWFEKGAPE